MNNLLGSPLHRFDLLQHNSTKKIQYSSLGFLSLLPDFAKTKETMPSGTTDVKIAQRSSLLSPLSGITATKLSQRSSWLSPLSIDCDRKHFKRSNQKLLSRTFRKRQLLLPIKIPTLSKTKKKRNLTQSKLIHLLPKWKELNLNTQNTFNPANPVVHIQDVLLRRKQIVRSQSWMSLLYMLKFSKILTKTHQARNNASSVIARCWLKHNIQTRQDQQQRPVTTIVTDPSFYHDEVEASFTAAWMKPRVKRAYKNVKRRHGWIYPCSHCTRETWRIAYSPTASKPVYLCKHCFSTNTFNQFVRNKKEVKLKRDGNKNEKDNDDDNDNIERRVVGMQRSQSMKDMTLNIKRKEGYPDLKSLHKRKLRTRRKSVQLSSLDTLATWDVGM